MLTADAELAEIHAMDRAAAGGGRAKRLAWEDRVVAYLAKRFAAEPALKDFMRATWVFDVGEEDAIAGAVHRCWAAGGTSSR